MTAPKIVSSRRHSGATPSQLARTDRCSSALSTESRHHHQPSPTMDYKSTDKVEAVHVPGLQVSINEASRNLVELEDNLGQLMHALANSMEPSAAHPSEDPNPAALSHYEREVDALSARIRAVSLLVQAATSSLRV